MKPIRQDLHCFKVGGGGRPPLGQFSVKDNNALARRDFLAEERRYSGLPLRFTVEFDIHLHRRVHRLIAIDLHSRLSFGAANVLATAS